jgi:hypothetical protein
VALVTLTMRHSNTQTLAELWEALGGAWNTTETSRGVRAVRDALGIAGFVRRVEATHGANGWHLHIHALAFIEGDADEADALRLGDALHASWSARLKRLGMQAPLRSVGTDVKLLDLSDPGAAVAGYITMRSTPEGMAGRELTATLGGKRGKRGNRTTWELLADAVEGDKRARGLWWEWEAASRGKRMLTWGCKVKALLDLDEEAGDDDLEATVIAALGQDVWSQVCKRPDGPCDLLEIAERAYRSQSHGGDLERNHLLGLEAAMTDVALTLDDWGVLPWLDLPLEAVTGDDSKVLSADLTSKRSTGEHGKCSGERAGGRAHRDRPPGAARPGSPPGRSFRAADLGKRVRAEPP